MKTPAPWRAPAYVEIKMDAEIGSYQEDSPGERGDEPAQRAVARAQPGAAVARAAGAWLLGATLAACGSVDGSARESREAPTGPEPVGTAAEAVTTPVSVLTQHNDTTRRGWNKAETTLNTSTVSNLQLKVTRTLPAGSGQIVGQLLYVAGASNLKGGTRDILVAVTTEDYVVAYDANDLTPDSHGTARLYSWNFWDNIPTAATVRPACNPYDVGGQTQRFNGITSTPVVVWMPDSGGVNHPIMYFVQKVVPSSQYVDCAAASGGYQPGSANPFFRVWAINVESGAPFYGPVDIGGDSPVTSQGVTFDPSIQNQRPGLLFWNGALYVAFGGLPDDGRGVKYHGWVMKFPSTLPSSGPSAVYVTTPAQYANTNPRTVMMGGIWQAGQGLVTGWPFTNSIYFMTGNGDSLGANYANLVESLDADTLAVTGYYAPSNWQALALADMDLGSAGPVFSPLGLGSIIAGGKEGILSNLDMNLKQIQPNFRATYNTYASCITRYDRLTYPHIHGSPVHWDDGTGKGAVYIWGERDYPRRYPYEVSNGHGQFQNLKLRTGASADVKYCDDTACTINCQTVPTSKFPSDNFYEPSNSAATPLNPSVPVRSPNGMSGGFLSLTGAPGNGILWGSRNYWGDDESSFELGVLHAMNADTMQELWNNLADNYVFAKTVPPTISNGKVYLPGLVWTGGSSTAPATNGDSEILIYGL